MYRLEQSHPYRDEIFCDMPKSPKESQLNFVSKNSLCLVNAITGWPGSVYRPGGAHPTIAMPLQKAENFSRFRRGKGEGVPFKNRRRCILLQPIDSLCYFFSLFSDPFPRVSKSANRRDAKYLLNFALE